MSRGDWMQTHSGGRFYPLDPLAGEVVVEDIAHALSEHALAALLHDATEAYVCDVPRPLKRYLPEYRAIEGRVWEAIAGRFAVAVALPAEVTLADTRIIVTERRALMSRAERWDLDDEFDPLPVVVTGWPPERAERAYLDRLAVLWRAGQ